MPLNRQPMRYAHAEGHTDVCYSEDGSRIVTCGSDGDIRVWTGLDDDDPSSHCVGEWALAVCYKNSRVHVAADNHSVQTYTYPSFDKDGIVTRFTGHVTHLFSSPQVDVIGCASEDMTAKICNLDGGTPLHLLSPHNGPVLGVAVCPRKMFAATSSGDGLVRLWSLEDNSVVKEITCVPKVNTMQSAKVLCRTSFEPKSGKYFAYPNNREIVILETNDWQQKFCLTHSQIKCAISQCLFSPCGNYIVGSTVAGQLAVWNMITGSPVGLTEHPTSHNVCAIAWNPTGNGELAFCDVSGQLGTMENCFSGDEELNRISIADANGEESDQPTTNDDTLIERVIDQFESDDDDNVISLEKLKNETLGRNGGKSESGAPSVGSVEAVQALPATVPPQPPFQPSSTPLRLEDRYMCWNEVGMVRCYTSPNGESTIDVEFHDVSLHHRIHLDNYLNHTMASLSKSVLVLGCETPSKMVCIALLGGSKEWSVSMPETEEILCVTATTHLVACATDARLLRLFTPLGTQREVISLAGPAVCLSGFNTMLMAVYHKTDPGVSDQHLGMDLIYTQNQMLKCKSVSVPLTPGSKLAWLGASDTGSPCTYDSDGNLRLYSPSGGVWLPVCDVSTHSKGISDSWFIVSVSESLQSLRAVLCRGTSFPLTAPLPIVAELPLRLPFCEMDTEKSQYEEQLSKWSHLNTDTTTKAIREAALKLFALACRSELEHRAIELMDLLHDDGLMPLAIRYASKRGRIHLADKLSNVAESWTKEENAASQEMFDEVEVSETGMNTDHLSESLNTNVNRILENNGRESTPIRPLQIKPLSARNPFKKVTSETRASSSPLSLTDRVLVASTPEIPENPVTADDMTPSPTETFIQWYEKHKSRLETENPELTPSELTKHSVKIFRKFKTDADGVPKRKLEETGADNKEPNGPASSAAKQSKLSAFSFQKKNS